MIKIELTVEQANTLLQLIDIAIKELTARVEALEA